MPTNALNTAQSGRQSDFKKDYVKEANFKKKQLRISENYR